MVQVSIRGQENIDVPIQESGRKRAHSPFLCVCLFFRPSTDWTRPTLKEEDNLPDSTY